MCQIDSLKQPQTLPEPFTGWKIVTRYSRCSGVGIEDRTPQELFGSKGRTLHYPVGKIVESSLIGTAGIYVYLTTHEPWIHSQQIPILKAIKVEIPANTKFYISRDGGTARAERVRVLT